MHMEVSVISGVHKGKYGKIIASREQDGQLSVTVQPWSISGNLKTFHLSADKVIEQWYVAIDFPIPAC
jgi:ribosomal protein L24